MNGLTTNLDLATTHLNVSGWTKLTAGQLAIAIREGGSEDSTLTADERAVASSMFVELSPSLIMGCMREAGATIEQLNGLYRAGVAEGNPTVPKWEQAIEHFL